MNTRQQRIFDFLTEHKAGVLASVDPNGEPHAAVIYHTVDADDFSLSFLTKTRTKKYDNLIRNNHVVYIVFDSTTQTVAKVVGKAKEIKDHNYINQTAQAISEASLETAKSSIVPITKLEAGDYVAFRIKPDQIRMATYSDPKTGDYKELFETLETFELKTNY